MLTPETPIEILKDILPVGSIQVWEIKVLSPKQLQQILLLLFAQVKVDDISLKLLNEIRQIFYSFLGKNKCQRKHIIIYWNQCKARPLMYTGWRLTLLIK